MSPIVREVLELAGQPGGDAEVGDLHLAGGGVESRFWGLMSLWMTSCRCSSASASAKRRARGKKRSIGIAASAHRHREPVERAAAEVLQDQRRLIAERLERAGP